MELPLNWKAVPSHSRPGQMSYVHEPSGLKQSNVPTGEPSEEAIEAFRDAIATAKRKVTPLWRVLRGRARALPPPVILGRRRAGCCQLSEEF